MSFVMSLHWDWNTLGLFVFLGLVALLSIPQLKRIWRWHMEAIEEWRKEEEEEREHGD